LDVVERCGLTAALSFFANGRAKSGQARLTVCLTARHALDVTGRWTEQIAQHLMSPTHRPGGLAVAIEIRVGAMEPTNRDRAQTSPVTVSLEAQPPVGDPARQERTPAHRQPTIAVAPIAVSRSTFFGRSAVQPPALIGARYDIERLPFVAR
jgi:hypothetical protein